MSGNSLLSVGTNPSALRDGSAFYREYEQHFDPGGRKTGAKRSGESYCGF